MNLYSRIGLVRLLIEIVRAGVGEHISLRWACDLVDKLFVKPEAIRQEYDLLPMRGFGPSSESLCVEEALNFAYAYRAAYVDELVVQQLNRMCYDVWQNTAWAGDVDGFATQLITCSLDEEEEFQHRFIST